MDLMGRPLNYRWKVTESEKKEDNDSRAPNPHQTVPKPPPGFQQQAAQQMQHQEPSEGPTLCFLAAIVKVLLVEEETKLQNDNHLRYMPLNAVAEFLMVSSMYQTNTEQRTKGTLFCYRTFCEAAHSRSRTAMPMRLRVVRMEPSLRTMSCLLIGVTALRRGLG